MSGAAKKVFIRSFGCQMNDYDTAKMADLLHAAEGYEPTDDVEQADLVLFNATTATPKVLAALERAVASGTLARARVVDAAARALSLKGCGK